MGNRGKCPLMYEWHGKKYWGAAHGLAGIMNVLLHMELEQDEIQDVKGTLTYMILNRFPSGNYPSSEGNESDRLVHWCHGAPGVALTLVKAAQVKATIDDIHSLSQCKNSSLEMFFSGFWDASICRGSNGGRRSRVESRIA